MRGTKVLDITHGAYTMEDSGIPVADPNADPDSVLRPGRAPGNGALIKTGTMRGPVEVTVEVLDTAPPSTAEEWERVEEETLVAAGDLIVLVPIADDPPEELPEMTVKPGDRYHLRVSVRGLRAGITRPYDTDDPPVEFHHVQLWPAS